MQIVIAFSKPGEETDAVLIAHSAGVDDIAISKNRFGGITGKVTLGALLSEITNAIYRGK
jgi:hypothetical protein